MRFSSLIKVALFLGVFLIFESCAFAELTKQGSLCDSNGSATFQFKYFGEKINLTQGIVYAQKRASNDFFNLSGNWYLNGTLISDVSSDDQVVIDFVSDDKLFLSKSLYSVKFAVSGFNTTFITTCPGIECVSGSECEGGDFCNPNGFCEILICNECELALNHMCQKKCDDGNICTNDVCTNGTCQNSYIAGCCLSDKNCNDGLMCTDDLCTGYRCTHKKTECKKMGECKLSDCREFVGCVTEVNDTCVKEKDKVGEFFRSSFFGKILKWFGINL